MITALMVKPGEQPCVVNLCTDTDFLNAVVSVGGIVMCTAAMYSIEKDIVAIFAYDGAMAGLRGNRRIGKRILAGAFYIARVKGDHLCSLTPNDIAKYALRFQTIEEYSDQKVLDAWIDEPF